MLLDAEVWCNPIGIDTSNHGYFDGDKGWLDPTNTIQELTLLNFKVL